MEIVESISWARGMAGHLGALASKVDDKVCCLRDALAEYRNIRNVIDGVAEEKERLRQEKERFKQEKERLKQEEKKLLSEMHANGEVLEAMKADLLASKNTLIAASNAITSSTEKISQQEKELEMQTGLVELPERNVGNELESVRNEMIKGFLVIDVGGRKLGIREMGKLNEKAFKIACLQKLPPEEVGAACYQLYSLWQKQLSDLSWYPFKKVTVDGNCQEIVNVDDDKLQELKSAWGEVAHDAVVKALMEMQEYNRLSDRSIAYELWNYKEGRKATIREGVEYMCTQVKQLSATKRRKTRRMAGIA
ncbi:hypothetical protein PR202_ga12100 [Eleusine coracana subsp. coracana]|uniref:Factor of DNA methylation 1-5/IDN2 domain-containing protein n=1 Tax=Eleusine coracana subsp. coracana TaxID=191504 RepID=A0AAV5CBF6_ELECO|nr:hypothetical protein PR202_ga12100 [Eleusine coracana subsp. coracana]